MDDGKQQKYFYANELEIHSKFTFNVVRETVLLILANLNLKKITFNFYSSHCKLTIDVIPNDLAH